MPAPDADPRYARIGLRTQCPSCGAHLPLNGPVTEADCAECGERVPVPPGVVQGALRAVEAGWPRPEPGALNVGDLTWRYTIQALDGPCCPACEADLGDVRAAELLRCPGCGATLTSLAPPAALRANDVGWSRVVGGDVEARRDGQPERPVVLACPACAAGLSVTSRHHRLTPCEHCGSQVHLPDSVWRVLHPPRTVVPWLIRLDGESRPGRAARLAKEEAEKEAEKAAQRAERQNRENEKARKRAEREAEARQKSQEQAREAEAKAREAEARRLRWTTIPLVVTGLGSALSVVSMLGSMTMFGVLQVALQARVVASPMFARAVVDGAIAFTLGLTVAVWLASVAVAIWRGATPVVGMLFWCSVMMALSLIPMAGPFFGWVFAWRHFRGNEPHPGDGPLPPFTGWPAGLLLATFPAFVHLLVFVAGDAAGGVFAGY